MDTTHSTRLPTTTDATPDNNPEPIQATSTVEMDTIHLESQQPTLMEEITTDIPNDNITGSTPMEEISTDIPNDNITGPTPTPDTVRSLTYHNQPDTSTNLVTPITINDCDIEMLSIRLNRKKEKSSRFLSHIDFINTCLSENLIPKGFKAELHPSIGNRDEEFLKSWYDKVHALSVNLMKDTISFCERTITETNSEITSLQEKIKALTDSEEYKGIITVIDKNADDSFKKLQEHKSKKHRLLKHNLNTKHTQGTRRLQNPRNSREDPPTTRSSNNEQLTSHIAKNYISTNNSLQPNMHINPATNYVPTQSQGRGRNRNFRKNNHHHHPPYTNNHQWPTHSNRTHRPPPAAKSVYINPPIQVPQAKGNHANPDNYEQNPNGRRKADHPQLYNPQPPQPLQKNVQHPQPSLMEGGMYDALVSAVTNLESLRNCFGELLKLSTTQKEK